MLKKLRFSTKFYLGIIFVVLSLIIGKVSQISFIIYFKDPFICWLSVIIYILSWPPFIIGVWWIGKEYAEAIQRYFSYKFYHRSLRKGTKKAYHLTKEKAKQVKEKARVRKEIIKDNVGKRLKQVRSRK